MQAAIGQRPEHVRIEIDHGDLLEQQRVLPLDFGQQRARRTEEAENDDAPGFAMAAFMLGIARLAMIEIAQADPLQRADQALA